MNMQDAWREKSDEEIRDAAKSLADYTAQAQRVILGELRARGLAKRPARRRLAAERITGRPQGVATSSLLFGVVFGLVGFVSGLVGPAYLNPSCNLCPITGFIATGPGCVLLGIMVGLWAAHRRLSPLYALGALVIGSLLVALASLALSRPGEPHDERLGELVDGTIVKCMPVETPREFLTEWERSIAVKYSKRYVARVSVHRKRDLYADRKASNHDSIHASPWLEKEESVRYYVSRELCATGARGMRSIYLVPELGLSIKDMESVPPRDAAWSSQRN